MTTSKDSSANGSGSLEGSNVSVSERLAQLTDVSRSFENLQKSIAMAYVDANDASEGNQLMVDLKGTLNPAKIVKLPFYKRAK